MQWIVIRSGATSYPVCHGPFSSFAQACEWIKVDPAQAHDLETDGLMTGMERIQIRPLYRP